MKTINCNKCGVHLGTIEKGSKLKKVIKFTCYECSFGSSTSTSDDILNSKLNAFRDAFNGGNKS